MSDRSPAAGTPTPEDRDRVTAELCEHFAAGHIELDALEARLAAVDEAESETELAELVRDLPALRSAVPVVAEPAAVAAVAEPAKRGWALALMGGASRRGEWIPPRQLNAVAVMGGVELDFRDALLPAGETHVTAVALMGGVDIVVPPGMPVTVRGLGLLGAVEQVEQAAGAIGPNTPRIRVTALACMGGVDIKTRASEKAREIASTRSEKRR
ncbi:MAG: DUF1707 and DUF2154 domain-containing protein [Gemmatimonadota bacterium]|nr:MAG: DUF1707 and DUF2154 domain-containing protein [Gemmatimonadota bacterium]